MLATQEISPKSGLTAYILCLFFGMLGFHRFYVGKMGTGILMLLTAGGIGFWFLYDLFSIICKNFTDSQGRVVEIAKNPTAPKNIVIVVASIYICIVLLLALTVGLSTHDLATAGKDELMALRLGNIEEAYSYTSSDFQKGVSIQTFRKFVNGYPQLRNNVSSTFTSIEFKNNNGVIAGKLNMNDGDSAPVELVLVKEYDRWKISEINMNQSSSEEQALSQMSNSASTNTVTPDTNSNPKSVNKEDSADQQ